MAAKIDFHFDAENKVIVAGIAIAVFAVFICFVINGWNNGRVASIDKKIEQEKQRLALRTEILKLDKLQSEYNKFFYKSSDSVTLRNIISTLGRESGVRIVSIKPKPLEKIGDFTKVSFSLNVNGSYNQFGKFLEKLETQPELTRVDKIEMSQATARQDFMGSRDRASQPAGDTQASISLDVSAYAATKK